MEYEVINIFPTLLAHATPVYHYDMSLPHIIYSQNLPYTVDQAKYATLKGAIFHQILG
jgi:hypothetical protein